MQQYKHPHLAHRNTAAVQEGTGEQKETHSYSLSPTLNARKPLAALTRAHSWSITEPDNHLTNWFLKWSFVNGPTHLYARENEARPASIHFWALFLLLFFFFLRGDMMRKSFSYLFISLITLNSLGYQTNYYHFLTCGRSKRVRNGEKKRARLRT